MLLNVWQSEREARGRRSAFSAAAGDGTERQLLVAALHAVGFGVYVGCIAARTVRALAAEEFPSDALWLDRCSQLDALAAALQARSRRSLNTPLSMQKQLLPVHAMEEALNPRAAMLGWDGPAVPAASRGCPVDIQEQCPGRLALGRGFYISNRSEAVL